MSDAKPRPPRKIKPPPNLQALIEKHGGYDKITPQGWALFETDMAAWKNALRFNELEVEQA